MDCVGEFKGLNPANAVRQAQRVMCFCSIAKLELSIHLNHDLVYDIENNLQNSYLP